jgi:hypothetical protein
MKQCGAVLGSRLRLARVTREGGMSKTIMTGSCVLLLLIPAMGRAQTKDKFCCEANAFFARRATTPGTSVAGGGADVFIYKGLAAGGDFGTTIGNPDDRITIGSVGASYHFLSRDAKRKLEPFVGAGYSFLKGGINTFGYVYPFDPGQDRSGPSFSQGVIFWPAMHLGARFEVREYRMFVSYGALENVIPGGKFVEFRLGVAFR